MTPARSPCSFQAISDCFDHSGVSGSKTAAEQTSKPIREQVAALEEGTCQFTGLKGWDYKVLHHLHCTTARVRILHTEDWKSIWSVVGCHV